VTTIMCSETLVATTNWASEVTICPNDGLPDVVPFMNTGSDEVGVHYAYVFADGNNNINFVHFEDSYDFEGSSLESDYVFGLSYYGALDYNIGDPIGSITADTCAQISSLTNFLTVRKMNCANTFDCFETNTATTNWASSVTICPGDGTDDIVPFLNNQFAEPGDHFAYLLTDASNLLIEVILSSSYNFEDSGPDLNRIFAISFAGTLDYNLGEPITNITADSCFMLSDQSLFLTIEKGNCAAETYAVSGTVTNSNGSPINGVDIMDGQGAKLGETDAQGFYMISDVAQGTTLTLVPEATSSLANGVTSTDLVLVVRHILDLTSFIDPYQLIAADANNSGTISATDLVQMRRALLGVSDGFANNTNWRFVDADQLFDLNLSDFQVRESMSVTIDGADVTDVDFIGVKIGDVNVNANVDLR